MADITITLSGDFEAGLRRIAHALEHMRPVMAQFGEYQLGEIENRFATQTDPDGEKWVNLKPSTWARKKNDKILTETTRLRGSFGYDADDQAVDIGSPVKYAATHQFGAEISIQPREREVYYSIGKDGRPGNRFTKKSRAGFAQRVRVGNYTVRIPARPILGIVDRDIDYLVELVADHLQKAGQG